MIAYPDRQAILADYMAQFEAAWITARLAYFAQFPANALAADWLTANPTAGVTTEAIPESGEVYLVGWPAGTPAPDFAAFAQQQTAAAEAQQAAQQTAQAAQAALIAAHQLVASATGDSPEVQAALRLIATAGAARLLG